MKTLVVGLLLVTLLVGCATSANPPAPPRSHRFERAERVGPADYLYAQSEEDFLQAQNVEKVMAGLEDDMSRKRQVIARLTDVAAAIRREPYLTAGERQAKYQTYMGQIRRLQQELLYQRSVLSGLHLQLGAIMGRSRLEQVRARAVEQGGVPIATY